MCSPNMRVNNSGGYFKNSDQVGQVTTSANYLTLLYTGYKMLGFTRGGHYGPPLETSKNEATEACEGSN